MRKRGRERVQGPAWALKLSWGVLRYFLLFWVESIFSKIFLLEGGVNFLVNFSDVFVPAACIDTSLVVLPYATNPPVNKRVKPK